MFEGFDSNIKNICSWWYNILSTNFCMNARWKIRLITIWLENLMIHLQLGFWLWTISNTDHMNYDQHIEDENKLVQPINYNILINKDLFTERKWYVFTLQQLYKKITLLLWQISDSN